MQLDVLRPDKSAALIDVLIPFKVSYSNKKCF